MAHPFVEFLTERDLIPASAAALLCKSRSFVRQPIGMIAVSHGLLRPDQIDLVLDRQRSHKDHLFGEIAVELGFLTRQQTEMLVRIQELRLAADITETLALAGVCTYEDGVRYLGAFLVRDCEVAAMMLGQA
ncbi:MAG: hypothetical protein KA354_14700 [Phycisphaerae bacterium]|nr:hypothetical protein [Phycisphaerae bacterium]